MAGIVGLTEIQHTNGTNAISVGTDGSVTGAFIPEFDMWRITANSPNTADADLTSDWERVDDSSFEKIGTGISESSGIFSFPSTGKYLIHTQANIQARNGTVTQGRLRLFVTQNNSSYTLRAQTEMSGSTDHVSMAGTQILFDVTNISNDKVKLNLATSANNIRALGDSTLNRTFISFMKLGAT
tara:strand:+ start:630 stop:1181 length:552 start_codon:yes stop_codon:yes gene_type:complete